MKKTFKYYRWTNGGMGYEVSSKGDSRFSAFNARLRDGRSIEEHYQCDVKGYDPGGTNWRLGKGKPSLIYPNEPYYLPFEYDKLWTKWAKDNKPLIDELAVLAAEQDFILSDMFATTPVNQARALAYVLNSYDSIFKGWAGIWTPKHRGEFIQGKGLRDRERYYFEDEPLKEIKGNIPNIDSIYGYPILAKCFTSNGEVKRDGTNVSGRGIAAEFRKLYQLSPESNFNMVELLGSLLNTTGNQVYDLGLFYREGSKSGFGRRVVDRIINFPTKHGWREGSDINLIIQSCRQLSVLIDNLLATGLQGYVLLPRPGCENGGLVWEEVREIIRPHLHPNVVVVEYSPWTEVI